MNFVRLMNLTLAAVIVIPRAVDGQGTGPRRPIELGVDASLSYESADDFDGFSLTIPVPRFRVGFFLSDALSFEPSIAFNYSRVTFDNDITGNDNTFSGTSYELDFGLLYHFSTDRTQRQVYLRPLVGIHGFSTNNDDNDNDTSASQAVFGAGLGVKLPATNRLATRLEAGIVHRSEDEPSLPSSNRLYAAFGISFFTR